MTTEQIKAVTPVYADFSRWYSDNITETGGVNELEANAFERLLNSMSEVYFSHFFHIAKDRRIKRYKELKHVEFAEIEFLVFDYLKDKKLYNKVQGNALKTLYNWLLDTNKPLKGSFEVVSHDEKIKVFELVGVLMERLSKSQLVPFNVRNTAEYISYLLRCWVAVNNVSTESYYLHDLKHRLLYLIANIIH